MADSDADTDTEEPTTELPEGVVDRAERLTRLLRSAVDPAEREAYRSDRRALLAEYGYTARVREDDDGETLVCHPEEWTEDGVIQIDRIDDTDRAVEITLSGTGDGGDYDAVDAHNRAVAEAVRDEHGDVHGETAEAFADFMSNHYAKRIEAATEGEREEFRTEYFPRNAWPSDEQRRRLEQSLEVIFDVARSR
jgi:hypothetical protein